LSGKKVERRASPRDTVASAERTSFKFLKPMLGFFK
jgi:hypothetical protein